MGIASSGLQVTQRQKIGEKIQFPEKVYVLITTHGQIDYLRPSQLIQSGQSSIDNRHVIGEVSKYIVPDGINVIKINPVSHGICNYLSDDYSIEVFEFMKYAIDNEFIPKYDIKQDIEFTTKSGKRIRPQQENVENSILEFLKRNDPNISYVRKKMKLIERENQQTGNSQSNKLELKDMKNYLNTPKYFLSVYTSGNEVPNKIYSYDVKDTNLNIIKEIGRNNKIFDVMRHLKDETVKFDPNIGETIKTIHTNEKKIVDFFKNNGVKELVLIDLSCSLFINVEGYTPRERTTRLFRKNIRKQQTAGRRKHNSYFKLNRNNNTKKRKNKLR